MMHHSRHNVPVIAPDEVTIVTAPPIQHYQAVSGVELGGSDAEQRVILEGQLRERDALLNAMQRQYHSPLIARIRLSQVDV